MIVEFLYTVLDRGGLTGMVDPYGIGKKEKRFETVSGKILFKKK